MKKTALCAALLLVFGLGFAQGGQTIVLKVKVQTANVRSEPDMSAQVVTTIAFGTLVEALSRIGSFYEIKVKNDKGQLVSGFISASVVDVIGGQTPPAQVERPVAAPQPVQPAAAPAPLVSAPRSLSFRLFGAYINANSRFSSKIGQMMTTFGMSTQSVGTFGGGIGLEFGSGGPGISFVVDALYAPGTVAIVGKIYGIDVNMTTKAQGLGLTGMLKYKFLEGTSPYILAGADLAYVNSVKMSITITGLGQTQTAEQELKDRSNQVEYGLDLGAGLELQLSGLKLFFEGRYNYGLSNQLKDPNGQLASQYDPSTGAEVATWKGEYIKGYSIVFIAGIKL